MAGRKVGTAKESQETDRLTLVRKLIAKWGNELEREQTKTGVAELIRLLVLEKELASSNETIREIKVTWVEPTEKAS